MPSNDEVVWGIPSIQCPSCNNMLDLSGKKLEKYSKAQRKEFDEANQCATSSNYRQPEPTSFLAEHMNRWSYWHHLRHKVLRDSTSRSQHLV